VSLGLGVVKLEVSYLFRPRRSVLVEIKHFPSGKPSPAVEISNKYFAGRISLDEFHFCERSQVRLNQQYQLIEGNNLALEEISFTRGRILVFYPPASKNLLEI
jgi:hypothetical protein